MSQKILGAKQAVAVFIDAVFSFLEHIDEDVRSDQDVPSRAEDSIRGLIADLLSQDPKIRINYEEDDSEEPDEQYNRAKAAEGWLDDNPKRVWCAPKDLHAACWYSHVLGACLAIKDGLSELEKACYPREKGNAHGRTLTRNTNWKRKPPGRPRKHPAVKFPGQPGRPINPNSKRQQNLREDSMGKTPWTGSRAYNARRKAAWRRRSGRH